ncbi:hypothetical protein [Halobaculum lipolyticum]|uniref:hypothetical protein n=1 Tax=Halobaculum lipolyticum TaxID=3032001 RepID=UPI0024C30EE2|nr:hypothetical protein [Halobaculum sp. DT31]
MTTPRQRQFLSLQAGWMLLAIALLASAGRLTGELVFVASFVGLVVVTALTEPVHATVDWRGRLRWPQRSGRSSSPPSSLSGRSRSSSAPVTTDR